MKNKLTRKLLLSVLTLAFAVVSLGASTFAWFTLSSDAHVQKFTAKVKAAEGIEIAVGSASAIADQPTANALTWYTGELPAASIVAASTQLSDPDFGFDAVTTDGSTLSAGALKMLQRDNTQEATGGFVRFYLYVRALAAGTISTTGDAHEVQAAAGDTQYDVLFTNETSAATGYKFTADAAYGTYKGTAIAVGKVIQDSVTNAARMSLRVVNNNTVATNSTTATNGLYELAEGEAEDGSVAGTAADPIVVNNSKGGVTPTGTTNADANFKGAHEYFYKKTQTVPSATSQSAAATTNKLNSSIAEYANNYQNIVVIEVTVWIEGNDWECMNALFAQTLGVEFYLRYEQN